MATTESLLGKTLEHNDSKQTVRVIELVIDDDSPDGRLYKLQIISSERASKVGRTRTASEAYLRRKYAIIGG